MAFVAPSAAGQGFGGLVPSQAMMRPHPPPGPPPGPPPAQSTAAPPDANEIDIDGEDEEDQQHGWQDGAADANDDHGGGGAADEGSGIGEGSGTGGLWTIDRRSVADANEIDIDGED
jgi:hypothetical protein